MVSSPISDMLQSPYHPDHIFGDEVTWYDAPDGLPEQEIKEYFDALEQQDVDDSVFRSKYVRNPEQNHYPTIPATNLHRKIFAFLETEKFLSSSIDYIHLTSITNKLAGLQRNHERFIAMQKFKIQKHVGELSAARKGLYDVDNVYTGSDCKRMRDLVMEKINACTCDRERVENEYLDTVSVLAKQVAEFQSKWVHERKELEARSAVQRQREKNLDIQDRLAAAMRKEKRLERKISALKAHNESLEETVEELKEQWDMQWERVWKMQRELRAHRDTIIIERRHRDEARQARRLFQMS